MKYAIAIVVTAYILSSCGNIAHPDEMKDHIEALNNQSSLEAGQIATSETGWTMTAKIDGKEWKASYFLSPTATDRIIASCQEEKISFPYDKRNMVVGKKMVFGENLAVDFFTSDEVGFWGGRKGELVITKLDNGWVEGKFFFTASSHSTDKRVEVTDGFFRISLEKK